MLDLTTPRDAHVDERLRAEPMMWLSTVRPDGRPHIVPVWFLWNDETILIFSQPNTQKLRNLQHNSHVMLALDTAKQGGDIVMVEGKATVLENAKLTMNIAAFVEKYDKLMARLGKTADEMAAIYSVLIQVTPTKFLGHGI